VANVITANVIYNHQGESGKIKFIVIVVGGGEACGKRCKLRDFGIKTYNLFAPQHKIVFMVKAMLVSTFATSSAARLQHTFCLVCVCVCLCVV